MGEGEADKECETATEYRKNRWNNNTRDGDGCLWLLAGDFAFVSHILPLPVLALL